MAKYIFSILAGVLFCIGATQAQSTVSTNKEAKPAFRAPPPDGSWG